MADLKVPVLLSVGVHPASGRPRMAAGDARALELALRLTPEPFAIHAGDPGEPALRDYLGMGLGKIEVLAPFAPGDDAVPALAARLVALRPDIVLSGMVSETGGSSGMLPYLVARAIGATLVAGAAEVTVADGEAVIVQAFRGAERRRLAAPLPVVITASEFAAPPRCRAFAKARRGIVATVPACPSPDREAEGWTRAPARVRPKRIRTGSANATGAPLTDLAPEDAARRVYDFLREKGIIEGARQ